MLPSLFYIIVLPLSKVACCGNRYININLSVLILNNQMTVYNCTKQGTEWYRCTRPQKQPSIKYIYEGRKWFVYSGSLYIFNVPIMCQRNVYDWAVFPIYHYCLTLLAFHLHLGPCRPDS